MGILRTDRVSGLGGANAIKGSVFFSGDGTSGTAKGTSLNIVDANDKADLNFGTGNFTFEAWIYPFNNISFNCVYSQAWGLQIYSDTVNNRLKMYTNDSDDSNSYTIDQAQSASGTILPDRWNHIAVVRNGSTFTMYTNGTGASPSTGVSSAIASSSADYTIGIFNSLGVSGHDYGSYFGFAGYISNLRIRTGAQYTSNFTPPVGELQKTSNTVLLACQSPGDITKEATGKTIVPTSKNLSDALPQASHFTPNSPVGFSTTTDVGTQFGSTFDGVTTFDSQAYFVPPGGNTRERNRGRAVVGWANNPVNTGMDVFNIQSSGNATGFGNLTTTSRWGAHAFSSATRGLWTGGYLNSGPAFYNIIEFITIANNGNPTDFADTTSQNYRSGCCSSSTRGVIALGFVGPNFGIVNTIDQVTMATAGNATNFGDLFQTRANMASASSPTRGFFAGGVTPANQGTIDFVTIASAGDAQDFGDLQEAVNSPMALASSTRGIIGGGYPAPTNTNVINFITIASEGNAQDFGDLTGLYSVGSAVSNKTRGVFTGGYTAPSRHNLMEFVTISTTGNAQDFGDLVYARRDFGACSDSHGGLE